MEEENDDYETDDDRLFQQIALESIDGRVNELRAIIASDDLDSSRQ